MEKQPITKPKSKDMSFVNFLLVALIACVGPNVSQAQLTVAAAGDIACSPVTGVVRENTCQMAATADLIARHSVDVVLTLGDNQYSKGRYAAFTGSYDETWGRFKDITYPSAGNHEYGTENAEGYYEYFGAAAGDPDKGYYSFDLGGWHLIALNSNCRAVGGCDADSPQVAWLERDLAAHPVTCTLAYWHHPRFSSGKHGDDADYQPFWEVLAEGGVDVVLNGHDHIYERFAPQTPEAKADPSGIRAFVVGTGGKSFYHTKERAANSERIGEATFGVLFLTLSANSYTWSFESAAGAAFQDSGSAECH